MTINATVDLTKTPPTLTVTSDHRIVSVSVTAAGDTAVGTATFPVTVTDAAHVWKVVSDDGKTATYVAS